MNRLACTVLAGNVGSRVTIEPLKALPVLKDLVVGRAAIVDAHRFVFDSRDRARDVPEASDTLISEADECMRGAGLWPWRQ